MRIETAHPRELNAGDWARWRGLRAANAALASPYYAPEWAQIVGAARADARICRIEESGYFAAQRLSRFSAMALGAPLADYQGVIAAPGAAISPAALCDALKVGRIDLTHVPAEQDLLKRPAGGDGSWIAETSGGRELYEAGLRLRRAEFVRQMDKKLRRLERAHGAAEFTARSASRADFETLIAWNNEQLARSGQPQIWAAPWVRQVIDSCFDARADDFSGILFTLRAGGELAAANFCLLGRGVLHVWIIGHDARRQAFSPGVQLARWLIGWAGDNGVREVDFGPGDYRYKRQLATSQRQLHWGALTRPSLSGAIRGGEYALRREIERFPAPRIAALPGKAMRRLDLMRALAV